MPTRAAKRPAVTGSVPEVCRPPAGRRGWSCRRFTVIATLVGIFPIAAGCASSAPKYQPVVETGEVCVTAEDLGVPPALIAALGSQFLNSRPTVDRFPTGVSVVRVAAMMEEKAARRHLCVAEMPVYSRVFWNHLWDDLPSIREVTILRTLGLDPRGADYKDLLRESVNSNCDLCIIVAPVNDTDADAEFVAVLWDAAKGEALAAFRAPVSLPEDIRDACAKSNGRGRWSHEAEFRAEENLRRLVRDAMWDLVGLDHLSPTTQPSPWRRYLPVFPRDYDRFRQIERAIQRSRE